jgi:hypothetical protein
LGNTRNAEWITKFLKKEVDVNGKKHMKGFTGTDADLAELAKWLESQKAAAK